MPGSTITSVLAAPYLSQWSFGQNGGGGAGTWADSTTGIFTVPSHPFTTGDVMYVKLFIPPNQVLATSTAKYYAIVVSPTQLRYASTRANALAGIHLPIPTTLDTVVQSAIGNHPAVGYASAVFYPGYYNLSNWMASSISSVGFSSTQNVQIDFTFSSNAQEFSMCALLFTKSLSYACTYTQDFSSQSVVGQGNISSNTASASFAVSLQNVSQTIPPVVRFTLRDRRINVSFRLNNGSYFNRFTGSLLAVNLEPLFFGVGMSMNGRNLNNCTITYL